jgi:hypothetical protein
MAGGALVLRRDPGQPEQRVGRPDTPCRTASGREPCRKAAVGSGVHMASGCSSQTGRTRQQRPWR